MKILIVTRLSSAPTYKQDDYLIMSLLERGVQVWVVTNSVEHKKKYENNGATVSLHHPDSKFSPYSIKLIRNILKQQKTDVLYLINGKAVANGAMAAIGLPVKVIAYRGAAGIYWHDPMAYLAHFHPRVDIICCISEFIRRVVTKNDIFGRRQYRVVHKGISNTWMEKVEDLKPEDFNIPPAEITIGCVANLRKVKGVHFLLEALKYIKTDKSIRLLIIGEKTDTPEFKNEITKAGLESHVFGLGFKKNIYSWINTCDIYVQPSLQEGLGKSIMEAMLLGKAVIATRSGGPEELIEDGKSGLIIPPKDPQAITRAIESLILQPEIRMELGKNARQRMQREFSLESYVDKMYNLFKDATADVGDHELA